jgi:hypothetical protein
MVDHTFGIVSDMLNAKVDKLLRLLPYNPVVLYQPEVTIDLNRPCHLLLPRIPLLRG